MKSNWLLFSLCCAFGAYHVSWTTRQYWNIIALILSDGTLSPLAGGVVNGCPHASEAAKNMGSPGGYLG